MSASHITPQQAVQQQQVIEELCGAAVRALSGDKDLHFRGHSLHKGVVRLPLHAAHLQIDPEVDDYVSYRGYTDGIALRLQHTDESLHKELVPKDNFERLIFELLEQLRVESLVPDSLPGMLHNLRARFKRWSLQFHGSGLTENDLGILLYTLAQVTWSRLNNTQVLEETEDFIESTRYGLAPIIGNDLYGLKQNRNNQTVFATHAKSLAALVHQMIQDSQDELGEGDEINEIEDDDSEFQLLMNFDESDDGIGVASALSGQSKVFKEANSGYQVFTTEFNKEVPAASLVRAEQLKELREHLDIKVKEQGININRLARILQSLFAVPERDGWSFGEEEGYTDGRRLSQLVSSPSERRLFKDERYKPKANAIVSFLIDCSGSMKQHIESIAVLIDCFGRALERANVSTEILGFSTSSWNGGRALQKWQSGGKHKSPGRLNEINYMVYKDAGSNWLRSRSNISALLKPDLFKEGVDGEAVEWACKRLTKQDAIRKVLVVISDGSPMDTATNLANDKFYLDNHLKEVVDQQQERGEIEIYGLGVGLDLSPFYKDCLALDLTQGLDNETFHEIFQLLSGKHHR